ncbi:MAG: hypothetical protein CSA86_02435 [Arcobacter sp.]|nr:MAG: hypothetical protein CSA86_02435 [Arcobacter sp.]
MEISIIIVLLLLIIVGFYFFFKKNSKVKNPAVKKEEIIQEYEANLQSLLLKYENNKQKQMEQKKIFLQKVNSELSRNIFFTQEESVKIIQRLLKI